VLAWMMYVVMVTLLLSIGAVFAERAARLNRGRTRWVWITAIVASLAVPTLIASVSVELPNVVTPAVAQKVVALREVTTQVLSPVMWISGSAVEPRGWRDFDSLLTTLWRAASGAMLLALLACGLHLFLRKRRWEISTVSGASVYVTDDVGPAVVGLLRPRIVVPQWVTMALPTHQSAVIAHEQSHLDARDPQLFTFALALLVLMPWNLPLWWQLRCLRYAIEVDCDARVLAGGLDPAHYGETLITVGERQSGYVGAVAAMSESRSFLEERIRIMLSKPVKWRRAGIAALAGLSVALTALAAQVSPPNAPGEPAVIKLPETTLDLYVGYYKANQYWYIEVRREGDGLKSRITGQSEADLLAESETTFRWRQGGAEIVFSTDGSGTATLRQNGVESTLLPGDATGFAQAQATLDSRIANQQRQPNTEAALRHAIEAALAGNIDYEGMEPFLAASMKKNEAEIVAGTQRWGAIKSITFKGVGKQGWDSYDVQFEKESVTFYITMGTSGKMAGLMALQTP
jgi:bla regulator protein BlaR1